MLRRGLIIVALLVALAVGLDYLVVLVATPKAPELATRPAILDASLAESEGVRTLGPCWWREHRGQHVLYVEGDPFTLGYCNARLSGVDGVMRRQEQALHTALETFVPLRPVKHILLRTLLFTYRDLPDFIDERSKLEILGIADGYDDPWRHLGETYGRILFFHAIHDISQALVDNPILACSAFAASGDMTTSGHTLLARNFDFEGGKVFDEDKVVLFYKPDHGIPFVSVIWAGMAGAVSGMNREKIGVVLNAAGSDDTDTSGTPTTLVVRAILEHATSIDEAIAIVRSSNVFVSDIFVVADGKTGEQAVIELTPRHVHVRKGLGVVAATNHLLDPAFKGDQENAHRQREGTTLARYERLEELLQEARGKLDVASAIQILRDRKLRGGVEVGLGHRGTIDALIAAHAVVFDLTSGQLHVSSSPHTLGAFVTYDLERVLAGDFDDRGVLPADPLLSNGGWARFQETLALLESSEDEAPELAVEHVRRALALTPDHPPALLRLGELCEKIEDKVCADEAYRAFLDSSPPNAKNAKKVRERLSVR